jgi:hypothetical protein
VVAAGSVAPTTSTDAPTSPPTTASSTTPTTGGGAPPSVGSVGSASDQIGYAGATAQGGESAVYGAAGADAKPIGRGGGEGVAEAHVIGAAGGESRSDTGAQAGAAARGTGVAGASNAPRDAALHGGADHPENIAARAEGTEFNQRDTALGHANVSAEDAHATAADPRGRASMQASTAVSDRVGEADPSRARGGADEAVTAARDPELAAEDKAEVTVDKKVGGGGGDKKPDSKA